MRISVVEIEDNFAKAFAMMRTQNRVSITNEGDQE
jgi:hypothetical protein